MGRIPEDEIDRLKAEVSLQRLAERRGIALRRPRRRPAGPVPLPRRPRALPVEGGSANDYDYCSGDPVNCNDLTGTEAQAGLGPAQAAFCLGPRALACGTAFLISRTILARANALRQQVVLLGPR